MLAELDRRRIKPNPLANRRTLARRLTFDLTGLPPAPAEVDRFEQDADPQAIEKFVDRLLGSPEMGERWARHWLDVARYADSTGYENDSDRPTAWHYRDFVIRACNEDLPFDQYVRWQLAGDEYVPTTSRLAKPRPSWPSALRWRRTPNWPTNWPAIAMPSWTTWFRPPPRHFWG